MEILRDELGVPHCRAESEDEAFAAQGWVHAADRLWQLEYDRRRASGRMAEVVGPAAVVADTFYRRIGLAASVQRDLSALQPETVAMLRSYAAGVNAWVERHPLPREFAIAGLSTFAPWEPWHSLLVFRVRHVLMGSARSKLWRAVVADIVGPAVARTVVAGWGEEHPACVPPGATSRPSVAWAEVDGGSNNWVVGGGRTASGLPVLAGDPHRELEAPNVYVQGHVSCPSWDVLGIGMPGVPGFCHFGHNERVAWSITHAMADDQDVYRFAPGAVAVDRVETVEVRDGEPVEVEVRVSPRGPMISDTLALAWTATATADVNTGFDAMPVMLRATSVEELFDAMRPWVEPANSLLGADVDGHIGYQLRGRLPVRRRLEAAWLPVDGEDESFGWDGWVPFESLARVIDPPDGFAFSANNHISDEGPYVGLDVAPPWRAARILSTLSAMTDADGAAMEALHRDAVSLPARRLLESWLSDWGPVEGWDGVMDAESTAAGAYSVFRRELLLVVLERSGLGAVLASPANRVLPGVLPETVLWRIVEQHLAAGDESLLGGSTWAEVVASAKDRAAAAWSGATWGELHHTMQRHVLARFDESLDPRVAVGVAGDLDTVFATGSTPTTGFEAKTGSVARYCWDLADWDRSGWVVPLGSAGSEPSPHAGDQQAAWAAGRLFPAPYTWAAVEASAAGDDGVLLGEPEG